MAQNANEFFEEKVNSTFSPMDYLSESKQNEDKYFLVDVRNGPPHLRDKKIKGAYQLPQAELEDRYSELPKDKILVLYCWDVWCNTAAKSALFLIDKGYDVKELAGGIAAWEKMEFETEKVSQ
ncbi:rhodanese-like domain-containing protein [Staphylococcus warneri]